MALGLAAGCPDPAQAAAAQASRPATGAASVPRPAAAAASGTPAPRAAAEPEADADAAAVAVFAVIRGDARLLRDRSRFRPAPGTGLRALDIVETGQGGFVQIAFRDGSALALGPSTRVMIGRRPPTGAHAPAGTPIGASASPDATPAGARGSAGDPLDVLYLLGGWIRRSTPPDSPPGAAPGFAWATPLGDVHEGRGVALGFLADGQRLRLFAEAGEFSFVPAAPVASPSAIRVRAGQVLRRDGAQAPVVDDRSTAEFLGAMPAAFRDALPPPAPALLASPRPASALGPLDGRELEPWLRAEPRLRWVLSEVWRTPGPLLAVAAPPSAPPAPLSAVAATGTSAPSERAETPATPPAAPPAAQPVARPAAPLAAGAAAAALAASRVPPPARKLPLARPPVRRVPVARKGVRPPRPPIPTRAPLRQGAKRR